MAYTAFDYTPINTATATLSSAVSALESNLLAVVHAIVSNGDFLSWDWQMQDSGGTYPPTTPFTPGQIIYTNSENTQQKIKVVYAWTGNQLDSMTLSYSSNGGTSYDPISNTVDTLGKVTLTYSVVPGAETCVISSIWS